MYKKTIIRQYFAELLKAGVVSVNSRVYSGRIDPKEDENYPYLTVFSKDESIEEQFTSYTSRELEIKIGVVVKDNQTSDDSDFDAIIENIMYDVEAVMGQVITVQAKEVGDNYALFNSVTFEGSTTEGNNISSSDIGGAMMNYLVSFDYELPIIPLVLNDFDYIGSIENIQITNVGVPDNV